MQNEVPKIQFEFSETLDTAFLQELYDNDVAQAELVFATSAEQIRTELRNAKEKFIELDVAALKKVIHKMKPLFGYVGLNKIIDEFAAFEEVCIGAGSIQETAVGFKNIIAITESSLQTIDNEIKRLNHFNTQCL